jgi:iron complex transport system ATP-binding protein
MGMSLKIEHLTTGYSSVKKQNVILQQEMNALLETGQLVCVLGPNGAGKSTLLKTLAGFLQPLSGEVYFGDNSLKTLDLKKLSRLVSVVLTDRFSDLYLTAFDVVRMGRFPFASFFGRMKKEDMVLINQTMDKLGVGSLKEKLFYNLSDGERQKVLIARALVQDTPVLLLDEPVAFIDSPGRIEIMELLLELAHKRRKAILMTTHDLETALHYADFLWLIHRNKPLLTGIPEDMVLQGKVDEYFQRPGLHFDLGKGRFSAESKLVGHSITISVKNGSPEVAWLKRALERNDFVVVETENIPENGIFIDYKSGSFRLYRDAKPMGEVQRIAAVLEKIEAWGNSQAGK